MKERMKDDPFDIGNDHEAFRLLDLIDVEFRSDPMSTRCFDARIVERVKRCVEQRKESERKGILPPLLTVPTDRGKNPRDRDIFNL